MMEFITTEFGGVLIVRPDLFRDERGFFLESYHQRKYRDGGIDAVFVQDNHSRSARGTIRGLHTQRSHPQGKLIRVVHGEIFDVIVDIRRGSPTFRHWIGTELSSENFLQCYVPPGFAHGFCVSSEYAEVEYKCTDFYDSSDELRIIWNDPAIGVRWPTGRPLLSEGDRRASRLDEVTQLLPVYSGAQR
jgi:dTDP-4-dehydrorhamnose 3,5-epimerase